LARQVEDLSQKREALKERLDAVSQQATQNQGLLSIVLLAAGLLTLVQGVLAFFGAQSYVKQADDAVQKIETLAKEERALAEEVRAKYPMFSRMEDALEAAFRRLADLSTRLNVDQNLYDQSDPFTRQEILSLEGFAAMQFLASAGRLPEVIRNLRLPGKFYADKYLSSKRTIEVDFERAFYYYSLERDKSNGDIAALNDLGWLYMEVAQPRNPDRAQDLMLESLRVNPDQQRALYNLGTITFDPQDVAKLTKAREYLERAVRTRNWEKSPNEEFASQVYYNLACTYSRLAEHSKMKLDLLNLAATALNKAADKGGTRQEVLETDLTTGDLVALATSAVHTTQVLAIAAKFGRAWAARASG
jgi:TPR repeat protein